jgi:molybdenum cofactor guanylyltransferase
VLGLWPVRLREDLRRAVVDEDARKVDLWTARHRLVTVPFADRAIDPFFNANTPEDFEAAGTLLQAASE